MAKKAEGFLCSRCDSLKPRSAYTWHRIRTGNLVCLQCVPSEHGKKSKRELHPDRLYRCSECERVLPSDWYYINKRPNGKSFVFKSCRQCYRAAVDARRAPVDVEPEELQLRSDCLYDYDLARNMFGYSHPESIAWVLAGYHREKVDEETLELWGMTPQRKAIWEPDIYESSTEPAED